MTALSLASLSGMVIDVHHYWHLLLGLGQVPPDFEQDLRVHELEDVHDPHIDVGCHVVPMAQEEHLLVVHALVPGLLLLQPGCDPPHEIDRVQVGPQVEQARVHVHVGCALQCHVVCVRPDACLRPTSDMTLSCAPGNLSVSQHPGPDSPTCLPSPVYIKWTRGAVACMFI